MEKTCEHCISPFNDGGCCEGDGGDGKGGGCDDDDDEVKIEDGVMVMSQ